MSRRSTLFWLVLALLGLALQLLLIERVVGLAAQVEHMQGQIDDLSNQAQGDSDTLDRVQTALNLVRSEFERLKAGVYELNSVQAGAAARELSEAAAGVDAALQDAQDLLDDSQDEDDAAPLATRLSVPQARRIDTGRKAPPT